MIGHSGTCTKEIYFGPLKSLAVYNLSPNLIDLIMIKTCNIISREQRRLVAIPPSVEHHSDCRRRSAQREKCELAWMTGWLLNVGRQIVHVDPLFRLESYRAPDVIRGLVVLSMPEPCLKLIVAKTLEGDAFDYAYKVCTQALEQLDL